MTQASDLGAIANQLAAFYRARVNVGFQALATQHYGASEPPVMYPNMIWFDSGTGYVKLRNPTNTGWNTVGTIGPPMTWTNVDVPASGWATGDVKMTYSWSPPSGWVLMNDGSIGDGNSGAVTRPNPDCWDLFNLLWCNTSDDWCKLYAAYTWTPTGRGASAAADWAAHRHILLPKVLGRVLAACGSGAGLSTFGLATWHGAEYVTLDGNTLPAHYHTTPAHQHTTPSHGHPVAIDQTSQSSWNSSGQGGFPTGTPTTTAGAYTGWPDATDAHIIGGSGTLTTDAGGAGNTGWAGAGQPHFNIQPTSYINYMIKL